uniref:Uncharacterized protein n=1 Tax=Arundo donax TaxID=35708 RepID=A0A0A8YKG8_ARUDO
MKHFSSRHP